MALTGPAAALVGPRTLLIVGGIAGPLVTLLTLAVPGVTRPKYLPKKQAAVTEPSG
jgi:hypothetical protein